VERPWKLGAASLRAQWGSSTAPPSGCTPNAARPRGDRADMERCAPPRPLARVEPGPSWNRYPRAGVESGPLQAWRSRRLCLHPPVPPDGGRAFTPSGLGGRRSTASDGGTPSTASLGPGGTGPFMEWLPSSRGGTRLSNFGTL